eukprot:gb/GECH01002108.1/.p1 GENE.gb/GECH01002108.1/~~gb/GECH01002108.1/.p1  ORF type:complete len:252 (+),score=52.50 gb/GECH01002108.1/:1-756(+)
MISLFLSLAMIFGPVTGFLFQYREIVKNQSSKGFSPLVSLILVTSNILRIFFWFGKRFETVLLWQSVVMVITQMFMAHLCTQYPTPQMKGNRFRDFNLSHFWSWEDFTSYMIFVVLFSILLAVITLLFSSLPSYVEFLGFAALMTEACLGIPQVLQNQKRKNTEGLSLVLIMTWVVGDAFKTLYFVSRSAPFQFLACGVTQLSVDFMIIAQIAFFDEKRNYHDHHHYGENNNNNNSENSEYAFGKDIEQIK